MGCCGGPRTGPDFDFDAEAPSDRDLERFSSGVACCPACGAEVYDDAAVCHVCGADVADRIGRSKTWVTVGAAAAIAGMIVAVGVGLL